MLISSLKSIFERDLQRLFTEISSYKNETAIWVVDKQIANSAGNLCLHLLGNLNWFIGATLGGTNYTRNREAEFTTKDVPVIELVAALEELKEIVSTTLDKLTSQDLEKDYALIVFDKPMTTAFFLVHLAGHLSYHLGQINYHRRLLDEC